MQFADCRKDDYYNADFLDGNDREFIRGFDWLTEMVIDYFFSDLELLNSDLMEKILSEKVPDSLKQEYQMDFTHKINATDPDSETRVIETYADYIRFKLLECAEMERNKMITSKIEHMDEDVYNAIRNRVIKDNEQKPENEKKEYYDSRKFEWTGKKESYGPVENEKE